MAAFITDASIHTSRSRDDEFMEVWFGFSVKQAMGPDFDQGMEALVSGCPNLVKVKVKKCKAVTLAGANLIRASRGPLAVNLDTDEAELHDASASDGAQENGVDSVHVNAHLPGLHQASLSHAARSASFK